MTLIQKYVVARVGWHKSLDALAEAEKELFVPGIEVRWEHGDHWRSGEVLEHSPGILDSGRVRVLGRAGKKQWVRCPAVLLEYLVVKKACNPRRMSYLRTNTAMSPKDPFGA